MHKWGRFIQKRMKIIVSIVIFIFLIPCLFYVISLRSKKEEIKNIPITLVHQRVENLSLSIPAAYLGPKFLDLSKKNLKGGEQRVVLLEFFYPSMQPNTSDNSALRKNEKLLLLSIGTGIPGAIRKFSVSRTSENPKGWFFSTGQNICGFREFKETKKRWINHSLYYYRDKKEEEHDIYFECDDSVSISVPCRMEMEGAVPFHSGISLYYTLDGYPKKDICEWKNAADKVRKLVNGFLVEGE